MARKKSIIDLEQVEDMASEFCTQDEIARDMGFERTMFRNRDDVLAAFERGKNAAKMSLRHMMFNAARLGDRTMMIFLAKNELGYADAPKADPANIDKRDVEDLSPLADLLNGKEATGNSNEAIGIEQAEEDSSIMPNV